ncbi:helix-turn-helix domain-containing protein [Maribacter sp. 2-571]|uniref:helix-turn-helix domain-containing protein n=1 Tax=Maribacter sp. 2-571 TaxID=3417569 RepID=UPI003D342E1F
MVNSVDFIKRLERILDYYGLTASAFADRIAVQRSSISHLLSGRNKPSLDFVLKVVKNFPEVNLYWLLNGKGNFPSSSTAVPKNETAPKMLPAPQDQKSLPEPNEKKIEKIIVFYTDGSFKSYLEI